MSDLAGTHVSSLFPTRPDPSTAITATILNLGIMISGILALVLALGLRISITLPSGRMGAPIMIFGSCELSGIGIFPEPTGAPHIVASLSFFASAPISMFYIGAAALDSKKKL